MTISIADLAAALGANAFGAVDISVTRPAEPQAAGRDELALAMSPRFAAALQGNSAVRAAVVWPDADWQALGLEAAIVVHRPRLAMAGLTQAFDKNATQDAGIDPTAQIHASAQIGAGVSIGAFCVIGPDAQIGAATRIASHVSIGAGVTVGAQGQIGPGVRLMAGVRIGARVILQPNVVIGGDGFSFVTAAPSHPETGRKTLGKVPFVTPASPADQVQHRIHSLGGVVIGDDVEVGANSTIDAGTIRATQVGDGTKIDNLVQVGHNVIVGAHCLLCAQTAIAGSSVIGDRCVLGGKSGVADNLTIGADCVVGGAAIVMSDVPAGSFVAGFPALGMQSYRAQLRALRHLPQIAKDWLDRQKAVSNDRESD